MSASDLVPRVVLFVTDLERKNAALQLQLQGQESQFKEQEDKQLLVQITGPNRTPIHYEGSLKHGFPHRGTWSFNFLHNQKNDVVRLHFTLSLFTGLEIWVGGIFIDNFRAFDRFNEILFFPVRDDSGSRTGTGRGEIQCRPGGVIHRGRGPVHAINASIGPMTPADYKKLTNRDFDLQEQIALYHNLNFNICSIMIWKEKIPGIMSLLKKLGIPTTDEGDDVDIDDDADDDENN